MAEKLASVFEYECSQKRIGLRQDQQRRMQFGTNIYSLTVNGTEVVLEYTECGQWPVEIKCCQVLTKQAHEPCNDTGTTQKL